MPRPHCHHLQVADFLAKQCYLPRHLVHATRIRGYLAATQQPSQHGQNGSHANLSLASLEHGTPHGAAQPPRRPLKRHRSSRLFGGAASLVTPAQRRSRAPSAAPRPRLTSGRRPSAVASTAIIGFTCVSTTERAAGPREYQV